MSETMSEPRLKPVWNRVRNQSETMSATVPVDPVWNQSKTSTESEANLKSFCNQLEASLKPV